jgi:hypothetical protein
MFWSLLHYQPYFGPPLQVLLKSPWFFSTSTCYEIQERLSNPFKEQFRNIYKKLFLKLFDQNPHSHYPYIIMNYIIYNAFRNTCFSLKLTAWPYIFGVPSHWPVAPNMPRRDGWGSGRSLMALAHVSPGPARQTLEIRTSISIFSAFFFKIRKYTK